MPAVRATTDDVLAQVRAQLTDEARAAAGNTILSRAEQAALPDGLLKRTAAQVRKNAGTGARVTVDRWVESASSTVATLLGQVNQASGPGSKTVSQDEVKALAKSDGEVGARVARAYELITGKHIDLDKSGSSGGTGGTTPTGTPDVLGGVTLTRVTPSTDEKTLVQTLGTPAWAGTWQGKAADVAAVLADPQGHKAFLNDLLFHGTGTRYEQDYPNYYTPEGLTVTTVDKAGAVADLTNATRDVGFEDPRAASTAQSVVGKLATPGTQLLSLMWTNHDDAWFYGVFAVDPSKGTIRGMGWAPEV